MQEKKETQQQTSKTQQYSLLTMFTSSSWGTKKPRCKPPQKYYSWTSSTRNQEAGKKKACAYWELNKNHTICKNPSTKNHNSQHAILILPTQRESRQDSRPFKSQKKKKFLLCGMVPSVTHQVTAELVSRRLQGLSNLISIALIKSHLAQFLCCFLIAREG